MSDDPKLPIYHLYNRSIAKYVIFNHKKDFDRMILCMRYYQFSDHTYSLSEFMRHTTSLQEDMDAYLNERKRKIISFIAYLLMPTHIHFHVSEQTENAISKFMQNLCNSYTRFFNIKYERTGPLWQGRFKRKLVGSDDQLLYLTKYIHLNPVKAGLVNNPRDWQASSYAEYLNTSANPFCEFKEFIDLKPDEYEEYVLHTS